MKNPVCSIYCFGDMEILLEAMETVMCSNYSFYYSAKKKMVRVLTRSMSTSIKIEKKFKALGLKTQRHYDR